MDVREKLVELLGEVQETGVNEIPAGFGCISKYITNEIVAAHLISHGVTVQELDKLRGNVTRIPLLSH